MSIVKIQQELKAPKNQRNNFGNYNYRSAEDIIEAVKPIAHSYGYFLNISDEIVEKGSRIYVKASAFLVEEKTRETVAVSVGWAREEETKKGMDGAQITGAASSYARKYALNGLLAIDDTKDADATNTHDKEPAKELPTVPDTKPWLNENNPNWNAIVNAIKTGQRTMTQLRDNFKVSKAVEAKITTAINS